MEKRIIEQLKTAKKSKIAHELPENASARERKQVNQLNSGGPKIEKLTEFQITDLEEFLVEDGLIKEIVRLIGQGKEANVYWVKDENEKDMALKLFRMHTTSHKDAFSKVGDTGKLQVAEHFALKEYLNLSYAQDAGVRVPKRGIREEFIFTMEFLGDETEPAPLLRNVNLQELGYDPINILNDILDQMEIMFNTSKLVHGDFSEHNLVWFKDKVWVIDFLQSNRWHPKYDTPDRIRKSSALQILKKDVNNILNHFRRTYRKSYYLDTVLDTLIHEKLDDWSPIGLMSEYYDPNWKNVKGR